MGQAGVHKGERTASWAIINSEAVIQPIQPENNKKVSIKGKKSMWPDKSRHLFAQVQEEKGFEGGP